MIFPGEKYQNNGLISRNNDLPAYLLWSIHGVVLRAEWYKNGIKQRGDDTRPGRVMVTYDGRGNIQKEYWYWRGQRIKPPT